MTVWHVHGEYTQRKNESQIINNDTSISMHINLWHGINHNNNNNNNDPKNEEKK